MVFEYLALAFGKINKIFNKMVVEVAVRRTSVAGHKNIYHLHDDFFKWPGDDHVVNGMFTKVMYCKSDHISGVVKTLHPKSVLICFVGRLTYEVFYLALHVLRFHRV